MNMYHVSIPKTMYHISNNFLFFILFLKQPTFHLFLKTKMIFKQLTFKHMVRQKGKTYKQPKNSNKREKHT